MSQSEADNHAVREAACKCIAEMGERVDPAAVRPHVRPLLDALMMCFRDQAWCFLSPLFSPLFSPFSLRFSLRFSAPFFDAAVLFVVVRSVVTG